MENSVLVLREDGALVCSGSSVVVFGCWSPHPAQIRQPTAYKAVPGIDMNLLARFHACVCITIRICKLTKGARNFLKPAMRNGNHVGQRVAVFPDRLW